MSLATPPLLRHYVDGAFIATDRQFDNVSPVDGRLVAKVCEADAATVDRAVRAARRALHDGPWGNTTPAERAAVLHRIADGIQARFDDFVAAEVADTGRPVEQARALDIARDIANFRMFADLVHTAGTEMYDMRAADGGDVMSYVTRKPLGVIGIISPRNLPLLLFTWKVAPALAMGNCVVAKPSEETPLCALAVAKLALDA
ncbi:MAG: aldehyde dehydrogenase family protein, partial [Pandoraea sp.]|nr:aldehyde dehydrogenase family protein [Pandoraea sp.]